MDTKHILVNMYVGFMERGYKQPISYVFATNQIELWLSGVRDSRIHDSMLGFATLVRELADQMSYERKG